MEQVKIVSRVGYFGRNEEIALIKNATVMNGRFRNFSGEKDGEWDQPGKRYFNIKLENPVVAQELADHNFPVAIRQQDDGSLIGYLKVHVKPDNFLPCIVKTKVGDAVTVLRPDEYAVLDGIKKENGDYESTMITSANLTLRVWEYKPRNFSSELEEGIFVLQPISYWDEQFAQEEHPHE